MKKNLVLFFTFFIFVFSCLILNTWAASKYVVFMDAVNIRKGAGTGYGVYKTGNIGSKYYLNSDVLIADTSGGCSGGWYEINYNGSSGYVCSEYVKVYDESNLDDKEPSTACEIALHDKGFPSSYFVPLCELQEKYPNWNFEPIKTGLDFNVVVSQESKCGKSYIETNDPNYIDTSCKSDYPSTSIWKPASYGAVRYYVDPRNFFTERYIFMFETLSFENALGDVYASAVTSVIKGTSFYKYHLGIGNDLGQIITNAGKNIGVSPIFIGSRILQEIGASSSLYNLYSGVYPGYEGYYNFYNYGVSDSCAVSSSPTVCGLEYAKSAGWYGLESAIQGGVQTLNNEWIKVGQNTRYLQKFNVSPTDSSKLYNHQYMTNIRAPYGEASTAYNSYRNADALNANFTFSIPVYENMPAYTTLPTNSDDNVDSGATGGGDSSSSVPSSLAPTSIITSAGYKYSGEYITGIQANTTVSSLKGALEGIGGNGTVTITDSNGRAVNSGDLVGTGYKVTINGTTKSTFIVLIYGDVSGDGKISSLDLLKLQKHILKVSTLSGAYLKAADANKDGKILVLDLVVIQKDVLSVEKINQ